MAAEGEGKSGMPQFDPAVFAPQLFWLGVVFAVLYLLMARIALPAIGQVIEQRMAKEAEDLDHASAAKADADNLAESYNRVLAEARAELQAVMAAASAEIAAKATARQHEVGMQIAGRLAAAETRIAEASKAAMAEISDVAAGLVPELTARLAAVKITPAEAKKYVKSVATGGTA
jgi:F-type H+-transporting ATPase subunit b